MVDADAFNSSFSVINPEINPSELIVPYARLQWKLILDMFIAHCVRGHLFTFSRKIITMVFIIIHVLVNVSIVLIKH